MSVTSVRVTEPSASAASSLAPEIQEGVILESRYRIGQLIGSGGMGVVFAAEHLELEEPVAIKFVLPSAMAQGDDELLLNRFAREAWAASKIKSEYVARVNDVGKLASGTPFLVMEYLEGADLADMLLQSGPLEIEQAVEFALQACEALAESHALGIVHRDLKPSNLFCIRRSDGLLAIKVLDFGISKITRGVGSGADLSLTTTAATVGSPLYMSPEQMSSARVVDARSDIWALGVILYELLTGRLPFSGANLPELALQVALESPNPLREVRPDVPLPLERVIARCLEKKPEARYASVAELARALVEFAPARARAHADRALRVLEASGQRAPAVAGSRGASVNASHSRLTTVLLGSHRRGVRPWGVVLVLLAILVVGGAGVLIGRSHVGPNVSPVPSPPVAAKPVEPVEQADTPPRAAVPEPASQLVDKRVEAPAPLELKQAEPPPPRAVTRAPSKPLEAAKRREARPAARASSELDSLGGRL